MLKLYGDFQLSERLESQRGMTAGRLRLSAWPIFCLALRQFGISFWYATGSVCKRLQAFHKHFMVMSS